MGWYCRVKEADILVERESRGKDRGPAIAYCVTQGRTARAYTKTPITLTISHEHNHHHYHQIPRSTENPRSRRAGQGHNSRPTPCSVHNEQQLRSFLTEVPPQLPLRCSHVKHLLTGRGQGPAYCRVIFPLYRGALASNIYCCCGHKHRTVV